MVYAELPTRAIVNQLTVNCEHTSTILIGPLAKVGVKDGTMRQAIADDEKVHKSFLSWISGCRRRLSARVALVVLVFLFLECRQISQHNNLIRSLMDVAQNKSSVALASVIPAVDSSFPSEANRTITTGAYFSDGTPGYVADPKDLSNSYRKFIQSRPNASYEEILLTYAPETIKEVEDDIISSLQHLRNVCSQPAGVLDEAPEGVELLTRKIQIAPSASDSDSPRLLCAIYTHPPMRSLARMSALTWGRKCDGFLAFSTETIPVLGIVHLYHPGDESYGNMWQKTRSILAYIRQHFSEEYDYFHIGGDDMYLIVENMKQLLTEVNNDARNHEQPLFLGQWVRQRVHPYVAGGSGYTMNRRALVKLVDQSLPHCHTDTIASFEDKLVSLCFRQVNVFPYDTRDRITGQQRYHSTQPSSVYKSRPQSGRGANFQSRAQAYFETLPHPSIPNTTVGPQIGLEAAARFSVTFHNLHSPVYMARVHAILYGVCAKASQLTRSLRNFIVS